MDSLLDLVALATIADVVPLQDENRGFVQQGLEQISRGARCGIRALKQVAGVVRDCSPETIAFKLAPRLNAAGRLDHAMLGVQLLTTESPTEAQRLAERLEGLNRERQKIEADVVSEAVEAVNEQDCRPRWFSRPGVGMWAWWGLPQPVSWNGSTGRRLSLLSMKAGSAKARRGPSEDSICTKGLWPARTS